MLHADSDMGGGAAVRHGQRRYRLRRREGAAAYEDLQEQVAVVAEEAGKSRDALVSAVKEMGQACGDCHDNFRAEEF